MVSSFNDTHIQCMYHCSFEGFPGCYGGEVNALCDCVCHSGLFAGENCSGKLIGNPATFWWHTLPVNHIQCV